MKMLAFWITVLITLGGCASIDTFAVANQCRITESEAVENQKFCNEAVGSNAESCTTQFPVVSCEKEWEAWNKHEEAVLRREKKRQAESYCAEQGLVNYCNYQSVPRPEDCFCITRATMDSIIRQMHGIRGW